MSTTGSRLGTNHGISVIIPTFDRLPRLRRVLEALAQQTVDPARVEVVVVSDGSTDGTDAYLAGGGTPRPVVWATQDNQGPAAARNRGVALASHPIVLFLDDDVVATPSLVAEHLGAHERGGPGLVVLGPMATPPDHAMSAWVAYEQAMLAKQYRAMTAGEWQPTARQFYTGNASVERDLVLAAGGFDPDLRRAEDVDLALRLAARGARFVFVPEAVGHHHAERPFEAWLRTAEQYGRVDALFARDRGQEWLLPTVAREYASHHPLTRLLVRTCLLRPRARRAAGIALQGVAHATDRLRAPALATAALSGLFNLTYYDGLVQELGPDRPFRPWATGLTG